AVFGSFAKHWHLGLGLSIMACVALLPHGLVGIPGQLRERLARQAAQRSQGTGAVDERI
ncbi:MAG: branched-chain amino acid ABC transporter permease, partial [Betaproteobacteria bacterium]|nr:branched-chain amino acid ABC transporter permease [Betaproteobacteria bacterium]